MWRAPGALRHCCCVLAARWQRVGKVDLTAHRSKRTRENCIVGNNKRTVRITKQRSVYYVWTRRWWRRLLLSSTVGATRVPPPDATHAYRADMRPKHTWLSPLLLRSSCSFDDQMSWVDGCLSTRSLRWWLPMSPWKARLSPGFETAVSIGNSIEWIERELVSESSSSQDRKFRKIFKKGVFFDVERLTCSASIQKCYEEVLEEGETKKCIG